MKRTLVVLALVVLSCAGCRAIAPYDDCGCCDPCGEPCQAACSQCAPRPGGCCEVCGGRCGRDGCLDENCPGRNCCLFGRYCGHNCGPGYGRGPYDCSPCGSCAWGCSGYRHPHGYVDGRGCLCDADGKAYPCEQCGYCHPPGPGYCGGTAAPGCAPCNSGDQYYDFAPGPPVGQIAYPYYTVRGPRDFLLDNPPPIGPY